MINEKYEILALVNNIKNRAEKARSREDIEQIEYYSRLIVRCCQEGAVSDIKLDVKGILERSSKHNAIIFVKNVTGITLAEAREWVENNID